MGKKASLKVNLDYYYADDDDDYDDDYWDEDDKLLPKTTSSVTREPSNKVHSQVETVHGTRKGHSKDGSSANSIQLYHRRPAGRPFSTLLLEHGHESLIFYVASFLDMRDISALSCVSRPLDEILACESLYCQPSSMLLPCLEVCPLPRVATPRLARSLALEASTLFQARSSNYSREKNIRQIQNIQREGHVVESILSPSGSRLTILGDDGSIRCYRGSADPAKSNEAPPIWTKQIIPENCLGVISSCLSQRYCAVLSMPSTGIRRYLVSVTSTDPKSDHHHHHHHRVYWQVDLIIPVSVRGSVVGSTGSGKESCLKIDEVGERLVVVFRTHLWVLSLQNGQTEWEHVLEHPNWDSWLIHRDFLVAITDKHKKSLLVYCLDRKCLAASGKLPVATTKAAATGSTSGVSSGMGSFEMIMFADRIWFTYHGYLYCTGYIFRRLDRWRTTDVDSTDHTSKHSVPTALRIKQFHAAVPLNDNKPILRQYTGLLYLADGPLIKMFTAISMESIGSDQPPIQPTHVLCAEGKVERLQADATKIICVISTEKKHRVEVFLNPNVVVTGGRSSLFHSICIKNAEVFRNRQELLKVEFQSGRLLVTARKTSQVFPYYVQSFAMTQQSQFRVYDLLGT